MSLPPEHEWALSLAAVRTHLGGGVHRVLGFGLDAAQILETVYGIENAQQLEEWLVWLRDEGHSAEYAGFRKTLEQLAPDTDLDTLNDGTPEVAMSVERLKLVLQNEEAVGTRALSAWDLGRLVLLAGWGRAVGYLSEDEAWKWIMPAAGRVQRLYTSWKEYGEHYVFGQHFCEPNGSGRAWETLSALLTDKESPWLNLPWQIDLGRMARPKLFVKRTRCGNCGGPKLSVPKSGYVYCDFCGKLTDFDFQVALSHGPHQPGPLYEALCTELRPELDDARSRGDREAYLALQRRIFSTYAEQCPGALSPRIANEPYRRAWVEFTAVATVLQDFDPRTWELSESTRVAVEALLWDEANAAHPIVRSESFWRFFRATKEFNEACTDLIAESGITRLDPDGAPPELLLRLSWSRFVQGWVVYTAPHDAEKMLRETGLAGDYVSVEQPWTTGLTCRGCGEGKRVPVGAMRIVCETCGEMNDVGDVTVACPHCGGSLTIPAGAKSAKCRYCELDVRTMRH